MLRKIVVLAAVAAMAVAAGIVGVSSAATTGPTYQFKDGSGNVLPGGKFGEDFEMDGSTTLSAGPLTNTCGAHISGRVNANSPTASLTTAIPGHTFSGCSSFPTYAAGNWTLTIKQHQTAANKSGVVGGIDVLVVISPGAFQCEFRPTSTAKVTATFANGSPSTATLGGSLALYTGSGTQTIGASNCPPGGAVSGTLSVTSATNSTNNITIG